MKFHDSLIELSKILGSVAILFALAYIADLWSDYRKKVNFEEEAQSIGPLATTTGAMWATAIKACNRVGYGTVYSCTGDNGILSQDVLAKSLADMAVGEEKSFHTVCQRHYSQQYCTDVVNRAYQISLYSN